MSPEDSTAQQSSQNQSERQTPKAEGDAILVWDAAVPMVGDRFFMWDMAKLWGISCGALAILMLAIGLVNQSPHMLRFSFWVPLWAFVAFYLLSMLIALVFYFNKYYVQTVISEKGVSSELVRWTGKLGKAVAAGNVVIGLLKASPTNVGAGVLANVQRSVFIGWSDIRKATRFPGPRVVTLSNSWRPVLRMHCPDQEIYDKVCEILDERIS
jgi:hypothetical protein